MKYITIHLYLPIRGCAKVTALYIICTALFPPALWVWCAWNHQRAIYWIAPLSVLSFKSPYFHNALPWEGHHINQDKVNKSIRSLDSIIALSFPSHIFPRERAWLRSLKLKHTLTAFLLILLMDLVSSHPLLPVLLISFFSVPHQQLHAFVLSNVTVNHDPPDIIWL